MNFDQMLVAEDKHMTIYRANIKIKLNGSITNTWIEIEAINANTARSLLQAQYGQNAVISVIRKSGQ